MVIGDFQHSRIGIFEQGMLVSQMYLSFKPYSIVMNSKEEIFVSDYQNHVIYKIVWQQCEIFVGTSGKSGNQDGTNALFNYPANLAIDDEDNIIVADSDNNTIRKITPDGVVTTIAGNNRCGYQDGPGKSASFRSPFGVATVGKYVFVADTNNDKIRVIDPQGNVSTVNVQVPFSNPCYLAVDEDCYLYLVNCKEIMKFQCPKFYVRDQVTISIPYVPSTQNQRDKEKSNQKKNANGSDLPEYGYPTQSDEIPEPSYVPVNQSTHPISNKPPILIRCIQPNPPRLPVNPPQQPPQSSVLREDRMKEKPPILIRCIQPNPPRPVNPPPQQPQSSVRREQRMKESLEPTTTPGPRFLKIIPKACRDEKIVLHCLREYTNLKFHEENLLLSDLEKKN